MQIDLGKGEQFGDAFRAVNPDCVVPALQLDDGSCISEVLAICDYLEAQHPEPALLGTTNEERAQILTPLMPVVIRHSAKELPQPQDDVALGLEIVNIEPSSPS